MKPIEMMSKKGNCPESLAPKKQIPYDEYEELGIIRTLEKIRQKKEEAQKEQK